MNNNLGRINIFTLTQEAAKAAVEFIQSLPSNLDGLKLWMKQQAKAGRDSAIAKATVPVDVTDLP